MRTSRTTERRVIGALLLTALLPLLCAMLLANEAIRRASNAGAHASVHAQAGRGLDLYRELAELGIARLEA